MAACKKCWYPRKRSRFAKEQNEKVPVLHTCEYQPTSRTGQRSLIKHGLFSLQLQSASAHFIAAKHTTPFKRYVDDINFRLVSYYFFSCCHISVSFHFAVIHNLTDSGKPNQPKLYHHPTSYNIQGQWFLLVSISVCS